uniref:Uncharacterized protein n=1 Tax=Cacopsylla melanoneura TaxID=428564 RepID=A0A8D8Z7C9_9HEMI
MSVKCTHSVRSQFVAFSYSFKRTLFISCTQSISTHSVEFNAARVQYTAAWFPCHSNQGRINTKIVHIEEYLRSRAGRLGDTYQPCGVIIGPDQDRTLDLMILASYVQKCGG